MSNNYKARFTTTALREAHVITASDLGHLFYDLETGRSYRAIQTGTGASTWEAEESMYTGPATSTDNAIARFNGTGGETLQDSDVTVSDDGAVYPADAQATETAQTAAGLRAGSAAAAGGNAGDHYFKSDGTTDVNVAGTWYSRSGEYLVANEAALPTGIAGDQAHTTDDDVDWRNEGGTWVPQTDDPKKIVAAADQGFLFDAAAHTRLRSQANAHQVGTHGQSLGAPSR